MRFYSFTFFSWSCSNSLLILFDGNMAKKKPLRRKRLFDF
jgi:hypothetical protein